MWQCYRELIGKQILSHAIEQTVFSATSGSLSCTSGNGCKCQAASACEGESLA
jgi:hypothetical protein